MMLMSEGDDDDDESSFSLVVVAVVHGVDFVFVALLMSESVPIERVEVFGFVGFVVVVLRVAVVSDVSYVWC